MPHTPSPANTSTNPNSSTAGSRIRDAKNAAKEFLSLDQHHNTEVSEHFRPAVVKERIVPTAREEATTALDREVHQDHYQTRIQPIEDHVVSAETHEHKVLPVDVREQKHGREREVARKLEEEAARFKSTTEALPTRHVVQETGTVAGEHVHHHVHETVQPTIEREIIQPSVIHTTKPILEKIEKDPTFHPATVQPKMTLEEFKRAGGTLEGREERREVFEGEPMVAENGGAGQTHPNARVGNVDHHTMGSGNVSGNQGGSRTGAGHTGVGGHGGMRNQRMKMERRNTPPVGA